MLSPELARRLAQAGLPWSPAPGDRFVVPDRDLDDEVFVLSDMVIERLDLPDVGAVLAFNGTTEWALDSLEAAEALWLPREDQLRELLGGRFVALERVSVADGPTDGPTDAREAGWVVRVLVDGLEQRHVDVAADAAYARALLAALTG